MAGEIACWCGPDRYRDARWRWHVAVVDTGKGFPCDKCSLAKKRGACKSAPCMASQRADWKGVHFELEAVVADRGPQGTEGGGE